MTEPMNFNDAVALARRAAEAQKDGEQTVRDASEKHAEAERLYRMAYAKQILQAHADGAAWTVAGDLARGEKAVADLRYSRDVAKGVLDAAEQRAWRHTADRKDALEFITWSRARDIASAREAVAA